ncbi:hypothetical protein GQ42DRAFT_81009 [Ramicandelaber brevisporus]|nr:hypothetical protein GQ42DRAFT_81009 [Ramicandelaber brevisporus]
MCFSVRHSAAIGHDGMGCRRRLLVLWVLLGGGPCGGNGLEGVHVLDARVLLLVLDERLLHVQVVWRRLLCAAAGLLGCRLLGDLLGGSGSLLCLCLDHSCCCWCVGWCGGGVVVGWLAAGCYCCCK